MKRKSVLGSLVIMALAILLQGCSSAYMTYPEVQPQLTAKADKALLVIARDTSIYGMVGFPHYLDKKFIGETTGGTYFITDVQPGEYYIAAVSESAVMAKVDFKPGKIYVYREGVRPGVWKARPTDFQPLNRAEMVETLSYCIYSEYDKKKIVKDLDDAYWQSAIDEHEAWVKHDPEGFKDLVEYQGF